ncbi:DUF881 domain-containing protein [Pontibacillus litoralis]|uniref:DUF881 domain-containing protein n=1 Tax=Pontibacillus litoralis JSM 072002 TaxID=1385512 RepID=A0A0A5G602_9BACI|nr:DUF881 domain-containing protein [Pontibacillus litoralis]KGX88536.1 hypothetical protein N784_07655 [Pontibacillus litoralis JSM 072002]
MNKSSMKIIFSFVLLLSGFLIAFSYQQTKDNPEVIQLTDQQLEKDFYYRQQLIDIEKENKELRGEVEEKKVKIQSLEDDLANQEQKVADYVEEKKKLQKLTGDVSVKGQGVEVTLSDADYVPTDENVNQYIVHESHIFKVVNEMLSSGANAIAINGQRIYRDSYIACTGPVVTVDGIQHPAPFVITAIGDPEVMEPSLELTHGVVDQLVNDNVQVAVKQRQNISMDANVSGEG